MNFRFDFHSGRIPSKGMFVKASTERKQARVFNTLLRGTLWMHKAGRFYHEIFITHATYREFMLGLAALPTLPFALRDILSNIYDRYKLRSLPLLLVFFTIID